MATSRKARLAAGLTLLIALSVAGAGPRGLARRHFVSKIALLGVVGGAKPAAAFCGQPFPQWAYFLDTEETLARVAVPGLAEDPGVYAQCLGNKKEEREAGRNPLLLVPGGPGLAHDYLETLVGVASSSRRVVEFDPLLTGKSVELMKMVAEQAAKKGRSLPMAADFGDQQQEFLRSVEGHAAQAGSAGRTFVQKENKGMHLASHGAFGAAAGLTLLLGSLRAGAPFRVLSVILASPLARTGNGILDGVPVDPKATAFSCVSSTIESRNERGDASSMQIEALDKAMTALEREADLVRGAKMSLLVTLSGEELKEDSGAGLESRLSKLFANVKVDKYPGQSELVHLPRRDDFVGSMVAFLDRVDKK